MRSPLPRSAGIMPPMKAGKHLNRCKRAYLAFKRFVDISGSLFGLIVLSPFFLLCAIGTKCSSKGPVIFKQERIGLYQRPFSFYKFRSMRIDAPQVAPSDITVSKQQALVTPWGSFMRKTSLDELPQLVNILKGDMSFIGPRPSQGKSVEGELIALRESKDPSPYEVRPGLSGMAQIYLDRNHDPAKKSELDSLYVKKLSLWLDIKLFLLSFAVLFGYEPGR